MAEREDAALVGLTDRSVVDRHRHTGHAAGEAVLLGQGGDVDERPPG